MPLQFRISRRHTLHYVLWRMVTQSVCMKQKKSSLKREQWHLTLPPPLLAKAQASRIVAEAAAAHASSLAGASNDEVVSACWGVV